MKYNPDIHHRRSIRLKRYDYSRAGTCFLTICTHQKECLFGDIAAGNMRLNAEGETAARCWDEIPTHFPHVQLDAVCGDAQSFHGMLMVTEVVNTTGAKDPILNWASLQCPAVGPEPNERKHPDNLKNPWASPCTEHATPCEEIWKRKQRDSKD